MLWTPQTPLQLPHYVCIPANSNSQLQEPAVLAVAAGFARAGTQWQQAPQLSQAAAFASIEFQQASNAGSSFVWWETTVHCSVKFTPLSSLHMGFVPFGSHAIAEGSSNTRFGVMFRSTN